MQRHPNDDLVIYNYTEKAQFDRHWNPVTEQCRGLIADESGLVVARPLPKIFNHDERHHLPGDTLLDGVHDKVDGSLGILYHDSAGQKCIATRGSFDSDQARHATRVLRTRYSEFEPYPGLTCLFEIVYPENRIVIDYGDTDDLVLLGGVDIISGAYWAPREVRNWTGPRAEEFEIATLGEAVQWLDRPNAEGFVALVRGGDFIKIKQPDYVATHKLVFGLNEHRIWEQLSEGRSVEQVCEPLPDEWHAWVREVAGGLFEARDEFVAKAQDAYRVLEGKDLPGRKEFALEAKQYGRLTPYLFSLYDGRDIDVMAWKEVKP